jgi:hypothetical protein
MSPRDIRAVKLLILLVVTIAVGFGAVTISQHRVDGAQSRANYFIGQ